MRYAIAVFGWAMFVLHAVGGCATFQEPAPCDPATLARMTAVCAARVRAECEPEPAPCPVIDECFAALDARQKVCLERVQ